MAYKIFGIEEATSTDVQAYLMNQMIISCTSGTRPTPIDGMRIWETDSKTSRVYVQSLTRWCVLDGSLKWVRKSGNESLNSSTTLQDDDQLTLAVEANAKYRVLLALHVVATQAIDCKISWSGPSGAVLHWSTQSPHVGMTNSQSTTVSVNYFSSLSDAADLGTDSVANIYYIYGLLATSTTPGSLTLRWCQTTSSFTNLTVNADSYLHLIALD